MSRFFRSLLSLFAHAAWQRSGKAGPLPALKNGKPLPVPSPWQIMLATWAAERLWQAFGDNVKYRLTHTKSPAVNRLGQMIPAPADTVVNASPATTQTPPTSQNASPGASQTVSSHQPQIRNVPRAQTRSQPRSQPRAPKRYDTQKLSDDTLPPGSVLGSLRSP